MIADLAFDLRNSPRRHGGHGEEAIISERPQPWFLHNTALSDRVIGIAIGVHKHLGPGLLESAYEECLCHDLKEAGIAFERQKPLPIVYKTVRLHCGYRMDLVIEGELVTEVKAVDRLMPIHEAQMLTCLRLGGCRVGLLMNFNSTVLKDGLRRLVL